MRRLLALVALIFSSYIHVMSCNPNGPNIVVNGDFSLGNYGFISEYTYTNVQNGLFSDDHYAVGSDVLYFHSGAAGSFYDHTYGTSAGSYLIVNGSTISNTILWSQKVAVSPNTDYAFSMWATNWSSDNTSNFAVFEILVNGVPIGTDTCLHANFIWQQITASWNSQSDTVATISIIDLDLDGFGNDFGIDDIALQSCAVAPTSRFLSSDSAFCEGHACISFFDLSLDNPTGWQWRFPGAFPDTSTQQSPANVCYPNAGNYSVTLIAGNSGGFDTLTLPDYIRVYPTPPIPIIYQVNDTILYCHADSSYASCKWFVDSIPVSGATDTLVVIHHSGNYNVQVTNEDGCNIAVGINVVLSGIENFGEQNGIIIFPDPAANKLLVNTIGPISLPGKGWLKIYNVLGSVCIQSEIVNPKFEIDISSLRTGVYFLQMKSDRGSFVKRFVKE